MFFQVSLFIVCVRISAATEERDNLRQFVQRDDLKASVRLVLSEDESFVRSVVRTLLQDARITPVKGTEEIKSLRQEVGYLKRIVEEQQLRINKLENTYGEKDQPNGNEPTSGTRASIRPNKPIYHPIQHVGSDGNKTYSTKQKTSHNKTDYSSLTEGPSFATQGKRFIVGEETNIAFCAYLDHYLTGLNAGQVIKYNKAILNEGNAYNTFTGIFTIPVSGVYMFTFFFDVYHLKAELRLVVDSVNQVSSVAGHSGDEYFDIIGGNTAIVRVNAGQSVWIETVLGDSHGVDSHELYRKTTFSGFYMFP